MRPMIVPLCAAALLSAARLEAQEFGAEIPPLPSRAAAAGDAGGRAVLSAGRAVGEAGCRAGGFFARGGRWIGRTCADLSVEAGRACARAFVGIFTDFQEKPVGTPPRYDQM